MDDRQRSFSHTLAKGNSGESPNTEEVRSQHTFSVGPHKAVQRNHSRDHARLAKLWHERILSRKNHVQFVFQPIATFKKAVKKIIYSLRVTNGFKSCLGDSHSGENNYSFQYYLNILEVTGTGEEEQSIGNEASSPKPLFDPALYKANREIRLSSETKSILSQRPSSRTPEQVQMVFRYLQTLPSFAEYPLYHQKAICQDATYQSFGANVTLLKQGHRADNFYFVLSGSATVVSKRESLDSDKSESVSLVKRGMAFGEAAIMTNSLRNVTVVSKTHIELLVVSKEDYAKIFYGRGSESGKKEYITFLKTIDFLRHWPVDILKSNPAQSQHCYFRRGAVIVRNSNRSPWLYVVKSGVCEVLIKLDAVKPRRVIGRKPRPLSSLEELTNLTLDQRRSFKKSKDKEAELTSTMKTNSDKRESSLPHRYRRTTLCYVPELGLINSQRCSKDDSFPAKINSITEEEIVSDFSADVSHTTESRKTSSTSSSSAIRRAPCQLPKLNKLCNPVQNSFQRKARTMSTSFAEDSSFSPKIARSFSLPSTMCSELPKMARTNPAFVRIDLLQPKRVFGLSELDFEYNALHPGRPASVSLVSRGAECIMISKKFFMEHANALTKRWIRLNVQPYLPLEKHQQTLQEKIDWETFKKKIVESVVG